MLRELPPRFIENILALHEVEGARWIVSLSKIVGEIERRWSLRVGPPFADLSFHFVAPCILRDGRDAVLKIAVPEAGSPLFRERKALGLFGGEGAVRLFRFEEKFHALLLEKLRQGENLAKICRRDDARATAVAIGVMRRLLTKMAPPGEFPTVAEWTDGLRDAEKAGFAAEPAARARDFLAELLAAPSENLLLHGDFHHQNILAAEREPYLAIDPKGLCGPVGFEISTFLNNPRGWLLRHPDRPQILAARLRQFSEAFAVAPGDLWKWAYAEAVLAAWWTREDGRSDWQKWLACAEMWAEFKL